MPHYLPVDEIEKALSTAADDFLRDAKSLRQEESELEGDIIRSLEEEKAEGVKKKLSSV